MNEHLVLSGLLKVHFQDSVKKNIWQLLKIQRLIQSVLNNESKMSQRCFKNKIVQCVHFTADTEARTCYRL